jgi:hypothetical protein
MVDVCITDEDTSLRSGKKLRSSRPLGTGDMNITFSPKGLEVMDLWFGTVKGLIRRAILHRPVRLTVLEVDESEHSFSPQSLVVEVSLLQREEHGANGFTDGAIESFSNTIGLRRVGGSGLMEYPSVLEDPIGFMVDVFSTIVGTKALDPLAILVFEEFTEIIDHLMCLRLVLHETNPRGARGVIDERDVVERSTVGRNRKGST